jgi:hypothetical protein
MLRESVDGGEVRVLGPGRERPELHVLDLALAPRGHDDLISAERTVRSATHR